MAELEGRTLDRYELRKLIGKGGMANVYEAYDPSFHRVVAIKVFKREDDEMLRRFIREAQLMASLHHAHLVQVYDTGDFLIDGVARYYIVMPMMNGGTLRLRIRRSPLSLTEICQCLRDISSALDYIHSEGIIHRDIKASNVLLNDEGRCYLTDFGIARITTDATQLTSTGNVLGTVDYVAPELFEVHQKADALSDLYSLGVLLYEMVTGRLPFSADNQLALISMHVNKQAPSPRQFVPDLPRGVESVISKALEKKPELRYQNATELAEAFCLAVSQSGIIVPPPDETYLSQIKLTAAAVNAQARKNAPLTPVGKASPLASETEGFVLAAPQTVPMPRKMSPETPLPPARPTRPSGLRRGVYVALLALLAIIILVGAGAYAILNHTTNQPQQGSITPAATSASAQTPTQNPLSPTPNLTATASSAAKASATETAVANPKATATAQANATVGPIQTAIAGQPAYQDALNDANNPATVNASWDQTDQCLFAGDGYHVKQDTSFPNFKGCREQNDTYGDLALSVNVVIVSGHSGGVFFRLSSNLLNNYDAYLFEIDTQSNYKISREQGTAITALQDWSKNTALQQGYNVKNTLQLIARGNTLQFYANGSFLGQIQNDYYTNGAIALLATSTAEGSDADVVYSNLKVYALS
jgi:serine/threonine protein kinase